MSNRKYWICSSVLAAGFICVATCRAAPVSADAGSARQVLQREHQYTAALLRGDARLLASVLAESFVDTSESGALRDKQQLLDIVAHQTPPTAITETDRRIQVYGDAAVVTVRFDVKGTDKGKPYDSAGRATDVWIKHDGMWYCVAAHSSAIAR